MPVKKSIKPSSSRTTKSSTPTPTSRVKPVVRALTGLSLRQLLKATPPYIQANAQEVIIRELKPAVSRGGFPGVKSKILSVGNRGTKHQYRATIVGKETDIPLYKQKHVICSCECDFFMYYCLSGDTMVLTDDGYTSIRSLAGPKDGKLSVTYMVDGKAHAGTRPFCTGKKKTITVHLSNGRKLKLTKDHRVLAYDGSAEDVWVKAGDLVVGDKIMLDRSKPSSRKPKFNRAFYEAAFIGVMMGDGTFLNDKPRIVLYGEKRTAILPLLIKAGVVKDVKDITCRHYEADAVTLNSRAIKILNKFAYEHKTRVSIKSATHLYGYLSGLVATDGCVTKRQINLSGGEAYLKELLYYMNQYGHNFPSLVHAYKKGESSNYGVRKNDVFLLCMSSSTLSQLRGYLDLGSIKQAKFDAIDLKPYKRASCVSVKKITENKAEDVYDITVPSVHRFVAEGVVVHNCEYALTHWGSAVIKYSNGEPPVHTNPGLLPLMCKHLTQLAKTIIQHKM